MILKYRKLLNRHQTNNNPRKEGYLHQELQRQRMASLGAERLKSDKRQMGGMLLILGAAALIFPQANLASLVGPEGTTASEGIPASSLSASVFVVTMGMIGMVIGYMQLVHDYENKSLTGFLILFTQLAWVPFITDLTAVGRGARSGAAFIPEAYEPSATDVKFVGAMGMMGILGYGTAFLGSFSFIQFALYSFQAGKPEDRSGGYFRGRMGLYTFTLFLVGLAQFLLGVQLLTTFGNGPLENGAVDVAMFRVNFPEISIFVGLVQILVSIYGVMRMYGIRNDPEDHTFQAAVLFQWVMLVSLSIITQIAYSPEGQAAAKSPSVTMLTLGSNVLPAYLDFKMRTVPEPLPADYYGGNTTEKVSEKEMQA